jgi:membrane protease YdiL (CAAX protease family)
LYLLASLLIGVLVAPWIYELLQLIPANGDGFFVHLISSLQKMPFHRYASRSVQITALVLLWPTILSLRIQRLSELSLYRNAYALWDLLCGLFLALVPLWLMGIFFLWQGWYFFRFTHSLIFLFPLLSTAALVAVFEEFFFRGLLLGLCCRFLSNSAAAVFTAFLFAGVHFLNLPHGHEEVVHWWSGLALLLSWGAGLPSWPLALGAFFNLFLVGIILAWVTLRTYSLWLAIGLHAAWIFGQQFFNLVTSYTIAPPDALLPWLGVSQIYGMVPVGLLTLIPLGLTALLLKRWLQGRVVVIY